MKCTCGLDMRGIVHPGQLTSTPRGVYCEHCDRHCATPNQCNRCRIMNPTGKRK